MRKAERELLESLSPLGIVGREVRNTGKHKLMDFFKDDKVFRTTVPNTPGCRRWAVNKQREILRGLR